MSTSDLTPTVVLGHGAFVDASSWNGVIQRLLEKGVKVTAPANPLRGIAYDSSYTAACSSRRRDPFSQSAIPTAAP